jgi:murein peptide amidase A
MRNALSLGRADGGAAVTESPRRSVVGLLAPLDRLSAQSPNLIANHKATFEVEGQAYDLPRYLFIGPRGGDEPIRLGIFAGLHGDEPEGTHALVRFLRILEENPEIATGYCLFAYPVCNPTGFEDRTHHARSGKDLLGEFWKNSTEPEVRLLQAEILGHALHGGIALRSSGAIRGFCGVARGATLTRHLIEPALVAAEKYLPIDEGTMLEGIRATRGVVSNSGEGVLSAPPGMHPRPFEISLYTPKAAPEYLKECAFVTALQTILTEYRQFIAYARNL